mgnify:CR=1 FL=1
MALPIFREEDAAQVGMPPEAHPHQVISFSLVPERCWPHRRCGGNRLSLWDRKKNRYIGEVGQAAQIIAQKIVGGSMGSGDEEQRIYIAFVSEEGSEGGPLSRLREMESVSGRCAGEAAPRAKRL